MRFSDKTLKRFWTKGSAKGIDPLSSDRLRDLLSALSEADHPAEMDIPGWAFHALIGDRKGQFAVEVRANFRLVFEWEDGEAVRVRQEDYHGE